MDHQEPKIELDVLRHIERLTEELNKRMGKQGRGVLRRYPLSFTLLALAGVVAVSEGLKGVLEEIGFSGHPWYLLLTGLIILIITGSLYKKLDKAEI